MALHDGGVEDDDRECRCTQDVHRLVSRPDALLKHRAREGSFDGPDRVNDSHDNQHEDTKHQGGREELADDVDNARFATGEKIDDGEEDDGKRDEPCGCRVAEIGGDRKLEGRRRRAGHGEDNAQAQDCRRAQDGTAYLAEHLVEGIAWATHRVHHEDAEARQHRIDEQKADEAPCPQVAAFLTERWRKDEIACSEEHREQGEPDDDRVLYQRYVTVRLHVSIVAR